METTIYKTAKASVVEKVFDESEVISIRMYEALNCNNNERCNPGSKYKYKMLIRHPEGTNASELFDIEALKLQK